MARWPSCSRGSQIVFASGADRAGQARESVWRSAGRAAGIHLLIRERVLRLRNTEASRQVTPEGRQPSAPHRRATARAGCDRTAPALPRAWAERARNPPSVPTFPAGLPPQASESHRRRSSASKNPACRTIHASQHNQTKNESNHIGSQKRGFEVSGCLPRWTRAERRGVYSSSIPPLSPASMVLATTPAWARIFCSMAAAISGCSRRNCLAFSRPWPMRWLS
jgi:hypothetical protein